MVATARAGGCWVERLVVPSETSPLCRARSTKPEGATKAELRSTASSEANTVQRQHRSGAQGSDCMSIPTSSRRRNPHNKRQTARPQHRSWPPQTQATAPGGSSREDSSRAEDWQQRRSTWRTRSIYLVGWASAVSWGSVFGTTPELTHAGPRDGAREAELSARSGVVCSDLVSHCLKLI
jgi:hypothetical protein